jgi:hypothetical protein
MFWILLWMVLTAGVMITSHITMEPIVANLIFGALLAWRSL